MSGVFAVLSMFSTRTEQLFTPLMRWEAHPVQGGLEVQHICRPPGSGQMLLVSPPQEARRSWLWIRRIDDPSSGGYLDHGRVSADYAEALTLAKWCAEDNYRRALDDRPLDEHETAGGVPAGPVPLGRGAPASDQSVALADTTVTDDTTGSHE